MWCCEQLHSPRVRKWDADRARGGGCEGEAGGKASAVGTDVPKSQDWAAGGADATRRLGSALGGVSVSRLHVGWGMALLCLGSALPRWLVRAFAPR